MKGRAARSGGRPAGEKRSYQTVTVGDVGDHGGRVRAGGQIAAGGWWDGGAGDHGDHGGVASDMVTVA